jgi:hypothetical protein
VKTQPRDFFTRESICVYTWMVREEREGMRMSRVGENSTIEVVKQGKHLCLYLDGEEGKGGDE